ncbi:glycosyltransferase family 2 protein [Acidaminobacter sp. JC074]|uniref:glycosyltransferase family 2 protein n=1 Tax=Acidaminobacter sp. JC074 TaxID=2530199 RepID=UPI001F0F9C25|nr:glycosyltransferase family 2 protein [Acidaminobacter sp. JC074]
MMLSIIIPVYNSAASLEKLNKTIDQALNISYEIIFVNDCSSDSSQKVLDGLTGPVRVLELPFNHGQQGAIFEGMKIAKGDYILTMDDDLQHNPKDISRLLEEIEKGYDLVYGISQEEMVNYRQVGSKLTAYFFKTRYKHLGKKRVSSFRIFTQALNKKALECPYKYIYLSGIMLKHTKKIGQVHIVKNKRLYGQSGYNFKKLVWLFLRLNFYYGYFPDFMKPKRTEYEKNNDVRRRQPAVERHT